MEIKQKIKSIRSYIKKHIKKILWGGIIPVAFAAGVVLDAPQSELTDTLTLEVEMTTDGRKTEVMNKYGNLTQKEWEDKIKFRNLPVKHTEQLEWARDFYPEKINRVIELCQTNSNGLMDMVAFKDMCRQKIERLKDKYATVMKELELRKLGAVQRNPIGTTYYIDFNAGDDLNDGITTITPWKSLQQYTSVTVRTPGDIAYVRAGTIHTTTTVIAFDEDGLESNYISIIGADATDDPWVDGSNVQPSVIFATTTANINLSGDLYWKIKNIQCRSSTASGGCLGVNVSRGFVLDNGTIWSNNAYGMSSLRSDTIIQNSSFYQNNTTGLYVTGMAYISSSTFNGGGGSLNQNYGILIYVAGDVWIKDSTFGKTTTHANGSVQFLQSGDVGDYYVRNTLFIDNQEWANSEPGGSFFSEDHDQVLGSNKTMHWNGNVSSTSAVVRTGGAATSAMMISNANATSSTQYPFTLSNNDFLGGDFNIYHSATTLATTTIYINTQDIWNATPTASELYVKVSYLDAASGATRSVATSTETLIGATSTWTGFNVVYTPLQAGWAYATVIFNKYEAGREIYVDIKPVITQ